MTIPFDLALEAALTPALTDALTRDYARHRDTLLEAARERLTTWQGQLRVLHREGASGRQIVEVRTAYIDRLIATLFDLCSRDLAPGPGETCCLLALGGYGRGELNPRSDIDLMFYLNGGGDRTARTISERVLYLLWDLGLDVGFSVRTQRDCLEQAARDTTVRTAMIDARFLTGDSILAEDYEQKVMPQILGRNSAEFIRDKLDEKAARLEKYGSSVYLLEPNIKEGKGGLRDLHTTFWVAQVKFKARQPRQLVHKGVLTEKQFDRFTAAFDYLWHIRNELHFLSDRKNEQLYFDLQEKIASFLGYTNDQKVAGVERFMQDYYAHAVAVEELTAALLDTIERRDSIVALTKSFLLRRKVAEGFLVTRGELTLTDPELLARQPAAILQAFALAQKQEVALSAPLKEMIRAHRHRITDKVRRSKEAVTAFLDILRYRKRIGTTLREMNRLRVLGQFIPEFERIFCLVQHDVYHTYTVDVHTLFAMTEVEKLWQGVYADSLPLLTRVAAEIDKGELLLLAVMFHDIGKGQGKNHSLRGREMVPTIARRLGLSKADTERLEFLVEHHLEMAHIAQRRDLHDPKLIAQFAALMGSSETLKMLYVLTFADIKAVGPDVWNQWKAGLLEELFRSTYEHMEKGGFAGEARSARLRSRKRKVVEILADDYPATVVQRLLRGFGPRYLLVCPKAEIARHFRLILSRGEDPLAMEVEQVPERGYTNLILSTLDHPGLFAQIAGVLAANGLNILGAQIYTNSNGEIVDVLQVEQPGEGAVRREAKLKKVRSDLEAVIQGKARVGNLVAKRKQPELFKSRPKPTRPPQVELDNAVSDDYTVIDIFAHDRIGLLYDITRTLSELGLYIDVSKISTKVDQVADTFYVKDIFGTKIHDADKLGQIRQQLLACLQEE